MLGVQKPGKGAAVPGDVPAPLCCAANECRLWLCFSLILFFFPPPFQLREFEPCWGAGNVSLPPEGDLLLERNV